MSDLIDKNEAALSAHEAVCAERYAGINARLKRIEQISSRVGWLHRGHTDRTSNKTTIMNNVRTIWLFRRSKISR